VVGDTLADPLKDTAGRLRIHDQVVTWLASGSAGYRQIPELGVVGWIVVAALVEQ